MAKKIKISRQSKSMSAQESRYSIDNYSTRVPETETKSIDLNITKGFKMNGLVWLVVLLGVIGLFLFFFKPGFVTSVNQETGDTQLDWSKLIIWTILFALVGLFILWITRGITGFLTE